MKESKPYSESLKGSVKAQASSNIALIKYWGKFPDQIPANASISYTLSKSYTEMEVEFESKGFFALELWFEGEKNQAFQERMQKYLKSIEKHLPFISSTNFKIKSHNTFPHSSGIASSASAYACLAKALMMIDSERTGLKIMNFQKASYLARLGSGSACRSIYNQLAVWGKTDLVEGSSDEFAIPYNKDVPDDFLKMNDYIAIIHKGEKSVSSSAGHALMEGHPYAEARFKQAYDNMKALLQAMKNNDMMKFGDIIENEALSLHAMMMTSSPSYILMQANTLEAINRIRQYRLESQLPVFFTLDAGANVHILFPKNVEEKIKPFITEQIMPLCFEGLIIEDEVKLY